MCKLPSTIYMPYPSVTTSIACLSNGHLEQAIREALRIYFDSGCDNGRYLTYAPLVLYYGLLACEEWKRRNKIFCPSQLLFQAIVEDMQWKLRDIEKPPYSDTDAQATRQHLMSQDPAFYADYNWTTP